LEALGINWGLLIAQLLNVILVIWLLSTLLYRPLLNLLNGRVQRIEESLRDAEAVKQQREKAEQAYEETLARARAEAQAIIAQAHERAKTVEAELRAQAQSEAERIKEDARKQSEQERDMMIRDLRGQMAQLVTLAASRVLGAEIKGKHDRLIEESLAELGRRN